MLDKSLQYIQVLMRRPAMPPPPPPVLPDGYTLRFWQPGGERHWAEIESSVDEFPDEAKAAAYYDQEFAPYPAELAGRQLFAVSPEGTFVGTSTAWWVDTFAREHWHTVHWVAVKPGYQGCGLGKALVAETLRVHHALGNHGAIYLTTQTYSHKAIRLYRALGFAFDAESEWPKPQEKGNPTAEAVAYLENLGLL
jgi:GNAT superfamily N-acetyltransferase